MSRTSLSLSTLRVGPVVGFTKSTRGARCEVLVLQFGHKLPIGRN